MLSFLNKKTSAYGSEKDHAWQRKCWRGLQSWTYQRPWWGALCTMIASLLVLWGPLGIIQSTLVPASTLWGALLVGGLLLAMGIIELFAPSQAPVAGAAGIVLSLVSLLTALGGLGIGMLLGIIGSSYVLAWRPTRKNVQRLCFWSVFGCSMALAVGLLTLIARGDIAVAAPIAEPFTSFTGRLECHNTRSFSTFSQLDHRTRIVHTFSEYCTALNVVTTEHVLGATLRITQDTRHPAILRGVTSETVSSQIGTSQDTNETIIAGEQTSTVSIETNVTAIVLLQNVESSTSSDISLSFV